MLVGPDYVGGILLNTRVLWKQKMDPMPKKFQFLQTDLRVLQSCSHNLYIGLVGLRGLSFTSYGSRGVRLLFVL